MRVRSLLILAAVVALALIPSTAIAAAPKAKLRFSASSYAVAENAGTATIAVTRSARNGKSKSSLNTIVTVAYSTANGTAVAGSDYTATNGRLTFPACGSSPGANDPCVRQLITVSVTDDNVVDGNKTVRLSLTSPSRNAVVVNPQKTVLTIADNEGPNHISFDATDYRVWELGPQAEIHVIRSGAGISGSSSVDLSTSNGSATAPGDFTSKSQSLSFAPGEVDKQVMVDITDDSVVEPTESFNVNLANATGGAAIDTASAPVTILDDDAPVSAHLALDAVTYNVTEGGDVNVTINRTASIDSAVSVDYATATQTATPDVDYVAAADTIDFDPGDTSVAFTLSTISDTLHEADESFTLGLSNPLPAGTVLDSANATIAITDDDPLPTISAGSTTVSGGSITVVIQLSNPSTTDTTVTYVIVDSNGNQVGTGTATVPAGSTSTNVQVPATGSGAYTTTISNPAGGTIDSSHASSTTQDQNTGAAATSNPTISVTGAQSGGSTVSFDVTIPAPTDHPVTVDYEVKDGAGNVIGTGTATIPAGSTTVTVQVPATESGSYTATISNPTGGTVDPAHASSATAPATGTAPAMSGTTGGSAPATLQSTPSKPSPGGSQIVADARMRSLGVCKLTFKAGAISKRSRTLSLKLKAGEACTVIAGASAKSTTKRNALSTRVLRALKTARTTVKLRAGQQKTLKLRFTSRGLAFMKRALAAKRGLTLTLVVIERDARKRVTKHTVRTKARLR